MAGGSPCCPRRPARRRDSLSLLVEAGRSQKALYPDSGRKPLRNVCISWQRRRRAARRWPAGR